MEFRMSKRKKSTPQPRSEGFIVEINWPHDVEGRRGKMIEVKANFIHGHPSVGVYIEDAGVDGNGQPGFKICGHPDYLDDLAEALKALATKIRSSGWLDG